MTELDVGLLKALLVENGKSPTTAENDEELGTLWELNRIDRNINIVNVTRPFKVSKLKAEWRTFSAQYLGETYLNSDEIQGKGAYKL